MKAAQDEAAFKAFVLSGRLMFRVVEDRWEAFFGTEGGEEVVFIGSISMNAVVERPARKDAFMTLMKEVVGDLLEEVIGERPEWPHPAVKAGAPVPEVINVAG